MRKGLLGGGAEKGSWGGEGGPWAIGGCAGPVRVLDVHLVFAYEADGLRFALGDDRGDGRRFGVEEVLRAGWGPPLFAVVGCAVCAGLRVFEPGDGLSNKISGDGGLVRPKVEAPEAAGRPPGGVDLEAEGGGCALEEERVEPVVSDLFALVPAVVAAGARLDGAGVVGGGERVLWDLFEPEVFGVGFWRRGAGGAWEAVPDPGRAVGALAGVVSELGVREPG